MFYYWDGYEIDGSDTDFDLVLPEIRQRLDFVKCFLTMPLFAPEIYIDKADYQTTDKDWKARILEWFKGPSGHETDIQRITIEEALLIVEEWPEVTIYINCRLVEQLPEQIRTKICSFSSTREPLEDRYKKNPVACMEPQIPELEYRGDMTVRITIYSPTPKGHWQQRGLTGYIRNPELFESEEALPLFTLNCGPGFYYEYAMYIMDYMEEHFPGLAVTGGLDCAGGWTEGCTYAASIYAYERIHIPVTYSVPNTLKYLTKYDLLRSYKSYYEKGKWVLELCDGFMLANPPGQERAKQTPIPFGEYAALAEKAVRDESDPFTMLLTTAINTQLPRKELFRRNPEAFRKLEKALQEVENPDNDWHYGAWFGFTTVNGEIVGEYRVWQEMKPYLATLLELAEIGEIDFIKEETYRRRQHD